MVHEKLKTLRERFGFSQKDLADLLGVDRVTYITYEKGKADVPYPKMIQLARLFGVPMDQMIAEDGITVMHAYPGNEQEAPYAFDQLTDQERRMIAYFRLRTSIAEENTEAPAGENKTFSAVADPFFVDDADVDYLDDDEDGGTDGAGDKGAPR